MRDVLERTILVRYLPTAVRSFEPRLGESEHLHERGTTDDETSDIVGGHHGANLAVRERGSPGDH